MTVTHRTPIAPSGRLMQPVPAGEGIVDDPELGLAERIDELAAQLGQGTPLSELSPAVQRFVLDLKEAAKRSRRTNAG